MNYVRSAGDGRRLYGIFALAAANILYFLLLMAGGAVGDTQGMIRWGALYMEAGEFVGGWYRLISPMFMHFDIYHLGSNLLMLMAEGLPEMRQQYSGAGLRKKALCPQVRQVRCLP